MRFFLVIALCIGCRADISNAQELSTSGVDSLNGKALKMMGNPDSLQKYANNAYKLANLISYKKGIAEAAKFKGVQKYFVSQFDSSVCYHEESLALFEELNDTLGTAKQYLNLATTYNAKADYQKTAENALISMRLFEAVSDLNGKGRALNLLGIIEYRQGDYKKALTYFKQHSQNALAVGDSVEISSSFNNIGAVFQELGVLDSAFYYNEKAVRLKERIGSVMTLGSTYMNLGNLSREAGEFDAALTYYNKALNVHRNNGDRRFESETLLNMGELYRSWNNNARAAEFFNESLNISEDIGEIELMNSAHFFLSEIFAVTGNFEGAYSHHKQFFQLSDSILNESKVETIERLKKEYETEKKEQQIALQESQLETQQAQLQRNFIVLAGLMVLLLLAFAIFYLYRRKQQEQQKLLVKEAQMNSSITSQEQERKRFAQDLHDGVGQLISACRLQIGRLEEEKSTKMIPGIVQESEKVLDEMHTEIRNITFNLMPSTLLNFGLVEALKEFARRINMGQSVRISVSSFDMDNRLKEEQEIALYRIVQEWVNNVIKYAEASHIQIQLLGHDEETVITIEDDGNGFDTGILNEAKGNGWRNIHSRISLIDGDLEIDSKPGVKGTTLIMEIPRSVAKEEAQKNAG